VGEEIDTEDGGRVVIWRIGEQRIRKIGRRGGGEKGSRRMGRGRK
jgi:hypothetical protein